MLVKELAKQLLSHDGELQAKALVNGCQGFHPIERIAIYKEDGEACVIIIASEVPALQKGG